MYTWDTTSIALTLIFHILKQKRYTISFYKQIVYKQLNWIWKKKL